MHADKDAQTRHDATRDEAVKARPEDAHDDKDQDEEEEATQQAAQKRYLLTLLSPGRQAEAVFGRGGVELPRGVLDEVTAVEVEGDGAFRCELRRGVVVDGVAFDEVIEGRVGAQEVDILRGVETEDGPVRRLEATWRGVRAITQTGRGPLLSG